MLCEFTGVVRDAFRSRGHDAVSCDLRDSMRPGPHIVADCLDLDWSAYDLVICHPPCKYLSRAGAWALKRDPGRAAYREAAGDFAVCLWGLPVPHLALENPVGHLWRLLGPPAQTVNPFDFGEPARKATCLWLRGLAPLVQTLRIDPPPAEMVDRSGKRRHRTDRLSGESWRRSATFPSIANAMAEQWGGFLPPRDGGCTVIASRPRSRPAPNAGPASLRS